MIFLDSLPLIAALEPPKDNDIPSLLEARRQLKLLVQHQAAITKKPLGVPAIVIAEYLSGLSREARKKQASSIWTSKFFIVPFDAATTHFCGDMLAAIFEKNEGTKKKYEEWGFTRQVAKADAMIVACAVQHKATALITGDKGVVKMAEHFNVKSYLAHEIPLDLLGEKPPDPRALFT